MIDPGLVFSGGAEVALQFSCAGSRVVSLLIALLAGPAAIRPPVVRCCMSKTKVAITPTILRFPADPTGDAPDLDVGHL